jgi:2-succinyl-5-enolpyruvyl-6-hydroxy-3-cyclohexene-1-carboxylate synthase
MTQEAANQKFQTLANLADLCARHGLREIIVSPGSRSAPLTMAFARHPHLRCRVVMDERAAGFIALGLAQQTQTPVGLVCTSGTAALNYAPAVVEAFYQHVPLLLFTADRPPEWIDQQDGQAIHQPNIFGPHCRAGFELPVDVLHPHAQWHAGRIISEAFHRATGPLPGPVHINVPLREPLYPAPGQQFDPQPGLRPIRALPPHPTLSAADWQAVTSTWQQAGKKLVVGGMQPPQPGDGLAALMADPAAAVIADLTANLHQRGAAACLPQWDMALGRKPAQTLAGLAPDLLVTFGGPVVSKYLKLFLRQFKPAEHWHLSPGGEMIDTYQSLTRVIPVEAGTFFDTLARTAPAPAGGSTYRDSWLALESAARPHLAAFLADTPFGEFKAVQMVLQALPEPSRLQLSNSMPIRYANFIGLAGRDVAVHCNRGASGIDGCVSTAVGAALATDQLTTLITGDLAFFYDRNALWHRHVPANLRVVLLNNHGGGIFKLIDGPANLPPAELEEYFFTPQPLNARRTAADHHCDYFACDNAAALQQHLAEFFKPGPRPALLEIDTDSAVNTAVFQQFKAMLAD